MSASKEELDYSLKCSVEAMTEILLRGFMSKSELLDRIEEILTELGYSD